MTHYTSPPELDSNPLICCQTLTLRLPTSGCVFTRSTPGKLEFYGPSSFMREGAYEAPKEATRINSEARLNDANKCGASKGD